MSYDRRVWLTIRRRLRYLFPLLIALWLVNTCGYQSHVASEQPASSFTLIYTTDMQGTTDPCG
ncbi:MAG: hypothetical protein Q7T82_07645 [Armatimonadota bacterium]|nr:hypothetical protein [Armatimonadota bacterium]